MTKRLGIFGGTFDPPHIGHQILAAEALDQMDLDQLLWVLTPFPPHKNRLKVTNLNDRLKMVEAAISDCPKFELSRIEIDRPPPHYAVDTLRLLSAKYPSAKLIYLMGGDSLSDLPEWHESKEFVSAAWAIGVIRRPGYQNDLDRLELEIPGINQKIKLLNTPLVDISASQIRDRIRRDRSYRFYLPPLVFQYIKENHLYKNHPIE
jgi:nicotinate-nucleotide adenylyltransferase